MTNRISTNKFLFITALILALFLPLETNAAPGDYVADAVLGQTNFTSSASATSATSLGGPSGIAIDPSTNRIYVCESVNNRVLSWPSARAFTNGQAADLVIGQADFVSNGANRGGSPGNNGFANPNGIALDQLGNLYVSDLNNHRVLEFDNPVVKDTVADRVFGQPDFTTVTFGTANNKLRQPRGIAIDRSGRLFVADYFNHRVLAFNSPLDTDTVADKVWGQLNFTDALSGTSNTALQFPSSAFFDDQDNLYIADQGNNRVLEFDGGFKGDATAERVYGQPDFTTATAGVTSSKLEQPISGAFDRNGSLYISDLFNNRIIANDTPLSFPGAAGAASRVIGQPNFTTLTSSTTASTFNFPRRAAFDEFGNLYVVDAQNNRVLRFDTPIADTAPKTHFTSNETVLIKDLAAADPFPSAIEVAGVAGTVSKVTVTLKHLTTESPDDIDVMLVGPTGKAAILMSDNGGSPDIYHLHLTFDDAAVSPLPNASTLEGITTVRPSNDETEGPDDATFLRGVGSSLGVFNNEDPNGEWGLYIVDDHTGFQGSLGGWGLNIFIQPELDRFVVAPTTAKAGDVISYTARITRSPGDTAISYTWDFGDGSSGSGGTVTHTYAAAGTYTATVTGISSGGAITQSSVITITPALTDLKPLSLTAKKVKGKLVCSFVVRNAGENPAAATKAQLRFGVASDSIGKVVKTFSVPALAAGEQSSKLTFTKAPGTAKYCRAVVDSANELSETNETNNAISKLGK